MPFLLTQHTQHHRQTNAAKLERGARKAHGDQMFQRIADTPATQAQRGARAPQQRPCAMWARMARRQRGLPVPHRPCGMTHTPSQLPGEERGMVGRATQCAHVPTQGTKCWAEPVGHRMPERRPPPCTREATRDTGEGGGGETGPPTAPHARRTHRVCVVAGANDVQFDLGVGNKRPRPFLLTSAGLRVCGLRALLSLPALPSPPAHV